MAEDCIFCRIVAGELPCHRVYEDEQLLAFLDINPLSRGHTLLLPKTHVARLDECPDELLSALAGRFAPLSRAITAAVGTDSFNVLCNTGRAAGQLVDHLHWHIIPRWPDDRAVTHTPAEARVRETLATTAADIRRQLTG